MANIIDGLHLIVDGTTVDPKRFEQRNLTMLMLQLAKDLHMDIIVPPMFKEVEIEPSKLTGDAFQDEGGISGYCMISTSHISIHCWPLRKVFMGDIFSCKPFDAGKAMDTLKNFLNPENMHVQPIVRRPQPTA